MIIAFLAVGVLFGSVAGSIALISGGSLLLALAVYSGVGVGAAIVAIALILLVSGFRNARNVWSEAEVKRGPLSA